MTSFSRATLRLTNELWEPLFFDKAFLDQTTYQPNPLPQTIGPGQSVAIVFESNGDFSTSSNISYSTRSGHSVTATITVDVPMLADNTVQGFVGGPDSQYYGLSVDYPKKGNHIDITAKFGFRGVPWFQLPPPPPAPGPSDVIKIPDPRDWKLLPGLISAVGGSASVWLAETGPESLGTRAAIYAARGTDGSLLIFADDPRAAPTPWKVVEGCPVTIVGQPRITSWLSPVNDDTDTGTSRLSIRLAVCSEDGDVHVGAIDSFEFAEVGIFSWSKIGGVRSKFAPAIVSWAPGRTDLFVTAPDGGVWHNWAVQDDYHNWEAIGGVLAGAPSAAACAPGRIDIVGRSTDANKMAHCWYEQGVTDFTWEDRDSNLTGDPSIASIAPRSFVIVAPNGLGQLSAVGYYRGDWGGWQFIPLSCPTDVACLGGGYEATPLFVAVLAKSGQYAIFNVPIFPGLFY